MKILLNQFTDEQILKRYVRLYPGQKKSLKGYELALKELRSTRSQKTGMQISITAEEDDGEKYFHVSGVYPASKNKIAYAIGFVPWRKWLSMEFNYIPEGMTDLDKLCHCLFEMTWYGFSNKEVNDELKKLDKISKQFNKDKNGIQKTK